MLTPNELPRFVALTKEGRLSIEIDKRVARDDGTKERVRFRRVLPAATSIAEAGALAAKLEHGLTAKAAAVSTDAGWSDYVAGLSSAKGSWLYVTVANCRHRSKLRDLECTVTVSQLRHLLLRCGGRCEVTGLRFTTGKNDGQRTRPYFHSVDRIRCEGGYSIDNTRIVCHAVNIAMNTWGETVFAEMARGFVFNRYSALYSHADSR